MTYASTNKSQVQKRKQAVRKMLQNSSQHPLDAAFLKREKHMLYVTKSHADLHTASASLTQAIQNHVNEYGLAILEIQLIPKKLLSQKDSMFESSFQACCSQFEMDPKHTDILVCQQAPPHVDEAYKGEIFRSAVISTGNEAGYLLGCISEPSRRFGCEEGEDISPLSTQITVKAGDEFLLNPQHIHYAMPLEMNSESLLILLQESMDDSTPQARQAIYAKYPPARCLDNMEELSHFLF